ncbi:MAG: thermonuclease family protein [Hyphomonadaceae bacterium]
MQPRLTRRRALAGGLAAMASGCSGEADLAGGESGRIARVMDGDALALDTGLRVRLAEVEAPAPGYNGRADEPFAVEARDALTRAALGRQARLWYGGLSRDGYERAIAHVIARDETGGDIWLNGLVARQGLGRVRSYPDNSTRARRLLALEAEARDAKRGLWADPHWRIRTLADLDGAPNYAIVEGELVSLGDVAGDGDAHLSPSGIRLDIGERLGPPDITLSVGARLRVRGRIDTRPVQQGRDPLIRITHWPQVEII